MDLTNHDYPMGRWSLHPEHPKRLQLTRLTVRDAPEYARAPKCEQFYSVKDGRFIRSKRAIITSLIQELMPRELGGHFMIREGRRWIVREGFDCHTKQVRFMIQERFNKLIRTWDGVLPPLPPPTRDAVDRLNEESECVDVAHQLPKVTEELPSLLSLDDSNAPQQGSTMGVCGTHGDTDEQEPAHQVLDDPSEEWLGCLPGVPHHSSMLSGDDLISYLLDNGHVDFGQLDENGILPIGNIGITAPNETSKDAATSNLSLKADSGNAPQPEVVATHGPVQKNYDTHAHTNDLGLDRKFPPVAVLADEGGSIAATSMTSPSTNGSSSSVSSSSNDGHPLPQAPSGFRIVRVTMVCQVCSTPFKVHVMDVSNFQCTICKRYKHRNQKGHDKDTEGPKDSPDKESDDTTGSSSGRASSGGYSQTKKSSASTISGGKRKYTNSACLDSTLLELLAKASEVENGQLSRTSSTVKEADENMHFTAARSQPEPSSRATGEHNRRRKASERIDHLIDERISQYLSSPVTALDPATRTSRIRIVSDVLACLERYCCSIKIRDGDGAWHPANARIALCLIAHLFWERSRNKIISRAPTTENGQLTDTVMTGARDMQSSASKPAAVGINQTNTAEVDLTTRQFPVQSPASESSNGNASSSASISRGVSKLTVKDSGDDKDSQSNRFTKRELQTSSGEPQSEVINLSSPTSPSASKRLQTMGGAPSPDIQFERTLNLERLCGPLPPLPQPAPRRKRRRHAPSRSNSIGPHLQFSAENDELDRLAHRIHFPPTEISIPASAYKTSNLQGQLPHVAPASSPSSASKWFCNDNEALYQPVDTQSVASSVVSLVTPPRVARAIAAGPDGDKYSLASSTVSAKTSPGGITARKHKKAPPMECKTSDIQAMDILCGKGKCCTDHIGSIAYKAILALTVPEYMSPETESCEKTFMTVVMVDMVLSDGGRFLREKKRGSGVWVVLGNSAARQIISDDFRDAVKRARKTGTCTSLFPNIIGFSIQVTKETSFAELVSKISHDPTMREFLSKSKQRQHAKKTRRERIVAPRCSSLLSSLSVCTGEGKADASIHAPRCSSRDMVSNMMPLRYTSISSTLDYPLRSPSIPLSSSSHDQITSELV